VNRSHPPFHPADRRALRHRAARGVTLVELMVGVVIGLLAVLVMAQVALLFEGQKRSTTAGSDAQVNGALALQMLQRDLQMSGYGFASGGGVGCSLRGKRAGVTPPWYNEPMTPVRIVESTDATIGSPDSLVMLYSGKPDAAFFAVPMRVFENHPRSGTQFVLDARTNLGNVLGDMVVAVPNRNPLATANQVATNWCTVFNISADPTTTGDRIVHDVGAGGPWNQDLTATEFPGTLAADVSYAAGSQLVNLGSMVYREYSLSGAATGSGLRLRSVDNASAAWTAADEVFPQIVNLQAVYGWDTTTPPDNIADTWSVTLPAGLAAWDWRRIVAVRVALVARSSQFEKTDVTTQQPVWFNGTANQTLTINHLPTWQRYRYKIFEAVVPLRNLLWQS
jgi:type IV pilus assembly protein PilW